MQVFGGHGYIRDHGMEQFVRDSRINQTYEGANGVQALDLVGRKLGQNGGANFQAFMSDVSTFVETNRGHAALGKEVELLGAASQLRESTGVSVWGSQLERRERCFHGALSSGVRNARLILHEKHACFQIGPAIRLRAGL
jgi:hypothetical protein